MDPNASWTQIVTDAKEILERYAGFKECREPTAGMDRTTEVSLDLAANIAALCEWLNRGGFPPDVFVPRPETGPLQGIDIIVRLNALIQPMQADPNAKLAALIYVFEQTARSAGLNVAQAVDLLCSAWARGDAMTGATPS